MLNDGERWRLLQGDCLGVLKELPAESAHALVCDPPAGIEFMSQAWDHHKGGRAKWVQWFASVMREALRVLKPGAHGLVWAMPRTQHWTMTGLEDAGFEVCDVIAHMTGQGWPKGSNMSIGIDRVLGAESSSKIDAPASPTTREAKQWDGWHSQLKPAFEPWILVQKPFKGSIAKNLLKHGVGALNIDACRIPCEGGSPSQARRNTGAISGNIGTNGSGGLEDRTSLLRFTEHRAGEALGRYPSNAIFSHNSDCTAERGCTFGCAVYLLERQSGKRKSGAMRAGGERTVAQHNAYGAPSGLQTKHDIHANEGTAARFFYCPKAKAEDARGGPGNTHPTVKHPELMAYLCKLVTPPDGIVLDPFAGSGSTGVAALAEGFRFVGIEQNGAYKEIAEQRLDGKRVERSPAQANNPKASKRGGGKAK